MPLSSPAMRRLSLFVLLAAVAPAAAAQSVVSPDVPVRGERVTVTFEAPVETAQVIYRPGSVAADTVELPASGQTVSFSPAQAGVVRVEAGGTSVPLSVRFPSPPLSGLIVMIGAGLVLFGGAAFAMRALLAGGELPDVTQRADT